MSRQLEGVKPGDVIYVSAEFSSSFDLHVVERTTATQAICKRASFKIDTGLLIGSGASWGRRCGRIVSETELAELQAQQAMKARIRAASEAFQRIKVTARNIDAAEAFIAASKPKDQP